MPDLFIDLGVLGSIPIIKGRILPWKRSIALEIAELHSLTDVPDLEKLVFGIGC